jgi:hypothetical protein
MDNSHEYVFTDEFDDVAILISLDLAGTSGRARLRVTVSELNAFREEMISLSTNVDKLLAPLAAKTESPQFPD